MANLQRLAESTPLRVTPSLIKLTAELGCGEPRYAPLVIESEAKCDACILNVMRAIRLHGGEICYGWLLRECPSLWISAEFHAVRALGSSTLVDQTPQNDLGASGHVLFAPDHRYGPRFDFRKRPNPVRQRTYSACASLTRMDEIDRIGDRCKHALVLAIEDYLRGLSAIDEVLRPTLKGRLCFDPPRFGQLSKKIEASQRRLVRIIDEQERTEKL